MAPEQPAASTVLLREIGALHGRAAELSGQPSAGTDGGTAPDEKPTCMSRSSFITLLTCEEEVEEKEEQEGDGDGDGKGEGEGGG